MTPSSILDIPLQSALVLADSEPDIQVDRYFSKNPLPVAGSLHRSTEEE